MQVAYLVFSVILVCATLYKAYELEQQITLQEPQNAVQSVTEQSNVIVEYIAESTKQSIDLVEEQEENTTYLGRFKTTGYCGCVKCCGKSDCITATGTRATQGRTIAVDTRLIPYGSKVLINGVEYIAEDTMAKWVMDNHNGRIIDVYFQNHEEAWNYGSQYAEIYLVKE